MAGAQRTLQAWAKGEVPPIENDGIVTAEDVGGLKLDSTSLVVLSACDQVPGQRVEVGIEAGQHHRAMPQSCDRGHSFAAGTTRDA